MSKIVHQESILVLGCERVAELPVWVEELPNGVRQITGLTSKTFSVFRHFNVNPALGDLFELVEALAKESSNVRCFVETDE